MLNINLRKIKTSPIFWMWSVCFLMMLTNIFILDEKWEWGHYLFIQSLIAFSISYFFLCIINPKFDLKIASRKSQNFFIIKTYWVFSFIGLILSILFLFRYGFFGNVGGFLINLRAAYIWDSSPLYGAQHFSLCAFCLSIYYAINNQWRKSLLAMSFYMFSAIIVVERTSILFSIVSILYIAIYKNKISLTRSFVVLVGVVYIFYIIAMHSGRAGDSNDFIILFKYFGYAITAFSEWMPGKEYKGCVSEVLGSFFRFFDSCGDFEVGFSDNDFNVLTFMGGAYLVAGKEGVLISMMVLGVIFYFLRKLALKMEGYFLAILACYMYSLVMIFYAWQFSLSTYVYIAVLFVPLFFKVIK